jgi:drug/metabolite transporter (DMT)-like permease
MFAAGLYGGERFTAPAWSGFGVAIAGLVILLWPGLTAPAPGGALLMALAGLAWGVYSLRGRGAGEPVAATASNFLYATPLALAVSLVFAASAHAGVAGLLLALASGALTSGLGYVIWYTALPHLSSLRAATVQLSVPPLAALGGVLLLGEAATLRLAVASAAILGGIGLVLLARSRPLARAP